MAEGFKHTDVAKTYLHVFAMEVTACGAGDAYWKDQGSLSRDR